MSRRVINVYVPPVSSFPELKLLGGYGLKDRIELPKTSAKPKPERSTGNVMQKDLHYLYVMDSMGRLLEHVRYYGEDYRSALRESFGGDQDTEDTPKKVTDLVAELQSRSSSRLPTVRPETLGPCNLKL